MRNKPSSTEFVIKFAQILHRLAQEVPSGAEIAPGLRMFHNENGVIRKVNLRTKRVNILFYFITDGTLCKIKVVKSSAIEEWIFDSNQGLTFHLYKSWDSRWPDFAALYRANGLIYHLTIGDDTISQYQSHNVEHLEYRNHKIPTHLNREKMFDRINELGELWLLWFIIQERAAAAMLAAPHHTYRLLFILLDTKAPCSVSESF